MDGPPRQGPRPPVLPPGAKGRARGRARATPLTQGNQDGDASLDQFSSEQLDAMRMQLKKVFQQGRPMGICDLVKQLQLQQPRPLVSLNKVDLAHILHIMQRVLPAGGALPTRVAQSRPLVGGRGVSPDTGSRGRGVTPDGRHVARWVGD